jgi:hypothetical protein
MPRDLRCRLLASSVQVLAVDLHGDVALHPGDQFVEAHLDGLLEAQVHAGHHAHLLAHQLGQLLAVFVVVHSFLSFITMIRSWLSMGMGSVGISLLPILPPLPSLRGTVQQDAGQLALPT